MAIKTFTTGEVLTASDTNTYLANAGLVTIASATLSGVTNTISNVFNSTFKSYRIVVTGLNNATTTTRTLNMRIGTDTTANYNWGHGFIYGAGSNGITGATGATASTLGNLSQFDGQSFVLDIHNPNVATPTAWTFQMNTYQSDVAAVVYRHGYGFHNVSTAFTGFQLIGGTDNLSGTVTVHGYRTV